MRSAFVLILFAILAGSCGPTVKIAPGKPLRLTRVALLPTAVPPTITRERTERMHQDAYLELAGAGFALLDQGIVARVCLSPECPDRARLVGEYGVDGFAKLNLASATRNDFLAGYYNAITGSIVLSDSSAQGLVTVEHTESERGGLLFNSGQLAQGLISAANNRAEDSQARLESKFVRTLVSKLPAPAVAETTVASTQNAAPPIVLSSATSERITPGVYKVCAQGTPDLEAFLLFGRTKTNLRPVGKRGLYCGIYPLAPEDRGRELVVELRSDYGETVRTTIAAELQMVCDIPEGLRLVRSSDQYRVEPVCAGAGCDPTPVTCSEGKFIVYASPRRLGPFRKIAEAASLPWIDQMTRGAEMYYQVVAINRDGSITRSVLVASLSEGI